MHNRGSGGVGAAEEGGPCEADVEGSGECPCPPGGLHSIQVVRVIETTSLARRNADRQVRSARLRRQPRRQLPGERGPRGALHLDPLLFWPPTAAVARQVATGHEA